MDQSLPPPDDVPNGPLIDAGAALAIGLIHQIRQQLAHASGQTFSLAFLRRLFRHFLRPAEAALRRAIYLIAGTLPPEPIRAQTKSAHPRVPRQAQDEGGGLASQNAASRTPAFRLTEPQTHPPTNHLPLVLRPRISIAGFAPPPPPPPVRGAVDPVTLEDRLHRRLAAFDAAFRDPLRAARRLLRLLARRTARRPLLAFTNIPGLAAKPLDAAARAILSDMNGAIAAAFARQPDTS